MNDDRTYATLYEGGHVETTASIMGRIGITKGTNYASLTDEQRRSLSAARRAEGVEAPGWSTLSDDRYYFDLLKRRAAL